MRKVIFIDDDPFFHFIIKKMLCRHSQSTEIIHSCDGLSIVNLLKKNLSDDAVLPDYIFVDLSMPEFNGWDFLEFYQGISDSIYKHINIYVVSSSTNIKNIDKSKGYSFVSSYITKPLTKKVLEGLLCLT